MTAPPTDPTYGGRATPADLNGLPPVEEPTAADVEAAVSRMVGDVPRERARLAAEDPDGEGEAVIPLLPVHELIARGEWIGPSPMCRTIRPDRCCSGCSSPTARRSPTPRPALVRADGRLLVCEAQTLGMVPMSTTPSGAARVVAPGGGLGGDRSRCVYFEPVGPTGKARRSPLWEISEHLGRIIAQPVSTSSSSTR